MNTHPVEERLRDALAAHAESFSASPDAWTRIRDRSSRRSRPRQMWHAPYLIPAAAAVTVVAVALGATVLAHGFSGQGSTAAPAGSATATPGPSRVGRRLPTGPAPQLLVTDPPASPIISLDVAADAKDWFWIGTPSPQYWLRYIGTSHDFCQWAATAYGGSGACWPMPALNPSHPAVVLHNDDRAGRLSLSGAVAPEITSVTSVLPDGRTFAGKVGTGRGFPLKAWAVGSPAVKGTRLVFGDAAGHVVANLSTAAPRGPGELAVSRPRGGGVTVFRYTGGKGNPDGSMMGYLVDGHAGFWSPMWGAEISPLPAAGPPVIAGLADLFDLSASGAWQASEAFGYAHANVAKVVVHLPGGGTVTAATVAAGWPGSDLRLWAVALPAGSWNPVQDATPRLPATAYDTAGHAIGHVQLGGVN
ncbi:MAG TPA: hypothetical protein VF070_25600 [Streptosporangiaceae bacterium]